MAMTPQQQAAYDRVKAKLIARVARRGLGMVGAVVTKVADKQSGIGCNPCQEDALNSLAGELRGAA